MSNTTPQASTAPASSTGYKDTDIKLPAPAPAPVKPQLNAYAQTNLKAQADGMDMSKTGYTAPVTKFQRHDIDTGLLEYNTTNADNQKFSGHQITGVGANIDSQGQEFKTSDNYLTDGAFVESRVNNMLSDDSLTMQRAKAQGLADAGTRGLQNTSMGATIGQAVMADKAIQIATPDAQTQAAADMTRQNASYKSVQNQQDARNQGSLADQAGQINSALSAQTAAQGWDSTKQKAAVQSDLEKYRADIAGAQASQEAQYAKDARDQQGLLEGAATQQKAAISGELSRMDSISNQNLTILQDKLQSSQLTTKEENAAIMATFQAEQDLVRDGINNAFNAAVAQAQLNAAQREALGGFMTEMANNYEISVQNIMLDPNLDATAKNAAITRMNSIFNQDMANIAGIFGASYSDTTT